MMGASHHALGVHDQNNDADQQQSQRQREKASNAGSWVNTKSQSGRLQSFEGKHVRSRRSAPPK